MPAQLQVTIGASAGQFRRELNRLGADVQRFARQMQVNNPLSTVWRSRPGYTPREAYAEEFRQLIIAERLARMRRAQRIRLAQEERARVAAEQSFWGRLTGGMRGFFLQYLGATGVLMVLNSLTRGIREFVRGAVEAQIQSQRIYNTLRSVSSSAREAGGAYDYLLREAKRVGFSFTDVADNYARFVVAAKQANYTGEETRRVFTAVMEAAAVMGLGAERTSDAILALEQMLSKGKVQAEELRRQLGNALPAAINIMARGLRMTLPQLYAALDKGALDSATAVKAFADQLRREFNLTDDMNRLIREQSRLKTAWWELKREVGSGLEKPLIRLIELTKEWVEILKGARFPTRFGGLSIGYKALGAFDEITQRLASLIFSKDELADLETRTIYEARKRREAERQQLEELRAGSAPTIDARLRQMEEEKDKHRDIVDLLEQRRELEEILAREGDAELRERARAMLEITRAQIEMQRAETDADRLRAGLPLLQREEALWRQKELAARRALEDLEGRLSTRVTRPQRAAAEGELRTAQWHLEQLARRRAAIEEEAAFMEEKKAALEQSKRSSRPSPEDVTPFQRLSAYAGAVGQAGLSFQRRIADNTRTLVEQNRQLLEWFRQRSRPGVRF